MKFIYTFLLIITLAANFVACSPKEMTPEVFIKMEDEFLASERTEEEKIKISKKYGFNAEQFDAYSMKVETDDKLKEELGAIRLRLHGDSN
jgi:hypothetical protein